MYLKRAALQRLNARLVNKKSELEGSLLRTKTFDLGELEPSTLTALDRYHISRWSQGLESGRACMLAVLDHRLRRAANEGENVNTGNVEGKSDIELSLLCASVNLPDDFLSDNGYLFTRIFSKAPAQVIREALEMLKDKAQEQSIDELDCDQINMAIKQIRIDIFAKAVADGNAAAAAADAADGQQENAPNSSASVADTAAKAKAKQQLVRDEELRLQVLVELIRLHIAATNPAESQRSADEAQAGFLPEVHILVDDLSRHLSTPLDGLEAKALGMEPSDLERSNVLLKPYITQLAGLRATLQQQLKALEENAAFYSLGLDRGAASSDAQIKRAYHSLAVRLHPDKGGDTAKFQALQDAYQEVLRRKKERSAAEGSLDDDCGAETAQHVVALVAAGVEAVQRAAAQTTALAQRNIRLMKDIEAATTGPGADTVTALRRLQRIVGAQEQLGDSEGEGGKGKRRKKQTGSGEDEAESDEDSLDRWMREMDAREPKLSVSSSPLPGRSKAVSESESEDESEDESESEGESEEGGGAGMRRYNLEELSAKQAVEPLESICEHLQLLAAKAMELPSCGSRYGMATARSTAFVEGVERSMAAGLASLKTTSSLSLADTQVSSSVLRLRFATLPSPNKGRGGERSGARDRRRRTRAAKRLLRRDEDEDDDSALDSDWDSDLDSDSAYGDEEDEADEEERLQEEEFRSILVEMLVTAFRSSSVTINIAAERAMAAVVAATSLHGALVDIVTSADEERREQARRAAEAAESEAHLSAEDREMMGQMKRQAMAKEKKEVRCLCVLLIFPRFLFSPLSAIRHTHTLGHSTTPHGLQQRRKRRRSGSARRRRTPRTRRGSRLWAASRSRSSPCRCSYTCSTCARCTRSTRRRAACSSSYTPSSSASPLTRNLPPPRPLLPPLPPLPPPLPRGSGRGARTWWCWWPISWTRATPSCA